MNEFNISDSKNIFFWTSKRFLDIFICLMLVPIFVFTAITLKFFNLFFNKGPVFFIQKRMGLHCKPFYVIKFRTMIEDNINKRGYSDPLELERITFIGRILRRTRVDELPQILNVIKNDMSLIGPRPDSYEHALLYIDKIPEYKFRHQMKPGISGLSQIRLGYAQGFFETRKKTKVDIFYIENASLYLDIKIFFGTMLVVFKGVGI